METATMTMEGAIPVACTLDAAGMERRGGEIDDLFGAVEAVEALPDGYAFRFPHARETVLALGEFVAAESTCCPFLTYEIVCEPGRGPVWLRLRGGDEAAREFAREMFVTRAGAVAGA